LCGVPALRKINQVEFNLFTGAPTDCLPWLLRRAGYRTIATQAFKPSFFNSERAYRSIGFEEIHFPTIYAAGRETYLQHDSEELIFDGDLFAQNLNYVERKLQQGEGPVLNYVLGIYGHSPHTLDADRHPPVIYSADLFEEDGVLFRTLNQIYYRSQALAEYLTKLQRIDPEGIILVTSDHLPALGGRGRIYDRYSWRVGGKRDLHQNIYLWLAEGSEPETYPSHHYEFADLILDTLTAGRFCREQSCRHLQPWSEAALEEAYFHQLVLGSRRE